MLKTFYKKNTLEAGCDEAGRGCLAGPVFAAAVILNPNYKNDLLNDSKQLSLALRNSLKAEIEQNAIAWAVAYVDNQLIDEINILNASILAMHKAIDMLNIVPELLLIDGNRFTPYKDIPHVCIVKGDSKILSIAAASVLAKTYRDEYMNELHQKYPQYNWQKNKGYPTPEHKNAIIIHGLSPYHRKSFNSSIQLRFNF